MTMVKQLLLSAVLLTACGGGKKGDTTPTDDSAGTLGGPHTDAADQSGRMVPPEKMDEIEQLLTRKGGLMSRCLAVAVDNKELPKNSHGKITLDITITPAGKAEKIKVIKATLESKAVEECVIGHVRDIQFPELPASYPTSHTYAFEAM